MIASPMASFVAKCLNTAPWVTPMAAAMSLVVIDPGLVSRASFNAAATISVLRSSVGSLVVMLNPPQRYW
ncbi:hypothetical protein D9M68_815480 [compost metagenome]